MTSRKSALSVLSSTDLFKYTCNRNQLDVTHRACSLMRDGCWDTKHTSPYPDLQLRPVEVFDEVAQIFVNQVRHKRFENHFLHLCCAAGVSESCVGLQPLHLNLATLSWLLEGKQQNWFSSCRRSVYYDPKKVSRIKLEIFKTMMSYRSFVVPLENLKCDLYNIYGIHIILQNN